MRATALAGTPPRSSSPLLHMDLNINLRKRPQKGPLCRFSAGGPTARRPYCRSTSPANAQPAKSQGLQNKLPSYRRPCLAEIGHSSIRILIWFCELQDSTPPCPPTLVMDKFLVRGSLQTAARKTKRKSPTAEDADSTEEGNETEAKRPRQDRAHQDEAPLAGAPWKHIQAEGLSCDYRILFGKAEADRIFQELEKEVEYFEGELAKLHVFGKWHNIPRKQVTYGDAGLTYTYSGTTFSPKPWIPVVNRIKDSIQLATGHTFNFVLINRYKDGQDHMGEHRDDERELVPRSPIASASFGACRDFVFRHGASRGKAPSRRVEPVKVPLEHGSLLMMNFPTNRYWYHSLPSRKKVLAPRVNLTFRKVMAL